MVNFSWRNFDSYLFDIDGTLLNCRDGVHYNSFHKALRQVWNCDLLIDTVPVHGNTDIGILRAATEAAGVSKEEFEMGLPQALATMQAEVERNAASLRPELCPSVATLIEELHSAGKLLGVTSGNVESIGWAKLRTASIAHYFSFGSFSAWVGPAGGPQFNESRIAIFGHGLDEARRRLGPQAQVCFLGDTPADIAAAQSLKVPIIALATGIYRLEVLREHGPDLCLPCCGPLLGTWQQTL